MSKKDEGRNPVDTKTMTPSEQDDESMQNPNAWGDVEEVYERTFGNKPKRGKTIGDEINSDSRELTDEEEETEGQT